MVGKTRSKHSLKLFERNSKTIGVCINEFCLILASNLEMNADKFISLLIQYFASVSLFVETRSLLYLDGSTQSKSSLLETMKCFGLNFAVSGKEDINSTENIEFSEIISSST